MAANKLCLTFTNLLINNWFLKGFLISICRFLAWFTFLSYANDLYAQAFFKPHLRLLLISKISPIIFIPWTSKNSVKSWLINHPYLKRNLNRLKPVGEVFPPRRSGTLRASLSQHPQNSHQNICRPRIPHALCPCEFSHRLLQCDVRGANSLVCCHFHTSWTLHHQWLLGLNTLHRLRWNTIDCSSCHSYRFEERQSRRHVALCCLTSS